MQNISRTRRALALGAGAAALALPFAGRAQGNLTHLIIAFPPGGPVDFVGRAISDALGKALGHTVLVENRAGANGAIAAEYVVRGPSDASVLWLTSVGAVAINPSLYEKLPYDPERDLVPVSTVVDNVEVLVVKADAPYNSPADIVAAARMGAKLSFASSGIGSVPHLALEQLNDSAKINILHVPYKGAAPAITDVIAGNVTGFFGDIPGLLPHIKAGKLKPVGIAAPRRSPILPQVKTFEEMGIHGVDSDNWYAIFTSKSVPPAQAQRVSQAVRKALADPAVKKRLEDSGTQPAGSTPAELTALLKKDSAKWGRLVKSKGIKAE
jgi:tripartite-type tricarboxylate transporter receptor subunit TctC